MFHIFDLIDGFFAEMKPRILWHTVAMFATSLTAPCVRRTVFPSLKLHRRVFSGAVQMLCSGVAGRRRVCEPVQVLRPPAVWRPCDGVTRGMSSGPVYEATATVTHSLPQV